MVANWEIMSNTILISEAKNPVSPWSENYPPDQRTPVQGMTFRGEYLKEAPFRLETLHKKV